jgi:hypothetical protein
MSDREEKFIISDFSAEILIPNHNISDKCYQLSSNSNTTLLPKILAIKFKLKYFSVKREHLFNHMPPGGEGPIDKIKLIEIIDKNNKALQNNLFLKNASKYKNFKYGNTSIDKNGHSGNSDGCLVAETFNSISEFITYYNFNSDKESPFRDVTLRNYHLFLINDSLINGKLSEYKIKFKMADGRILINKIANKKSD